MLLGVGLLLICATSGCALPKRTALIKRIISSLNELSDILCHIKDEEGAKQWKPKLKQLRDRIKKDEEELKKESKPTEEEAKELAELFDKDVHYTVQRLIKEIGRVQQDPAIWEVIKDKNAVQNLEKLDLNMEPKKKVTPPQPLGGPPKGGPPQGGPPKGGPPQGGPPRGP
jgi:hypothetical protein